MWLTGKLDAEDGFAFAAWVHDRIPLWFCVKLPPTPPHLFRGSSLSPLANDAGVCSVMSAIARVCTWIESAWYRE